MVDAESLVAPLAGGALIGLAASVMLLVQGRVAGISGIVGGLAAPKAGDAGWRLAFVAGLLVAGAVGAVFWPAALSEASGRQMWLTVPAGLLVGFGTRLGNGCTSGHGVCGISRGSRRSLVSVVTFIGVGMFVATVLGRLMGGVS